METNRYRMAEPKVVAENIDGEVLAIDMASGVYYNLRGWSARLWDLFAAGHTLAEVQQSVCAEVPGADPDAIAALFDQILSEGLMVPADDVAGAASVPLSSVSDLAWTPLEIERFTDMSDLILLDPVHEVDTVSGWPRAQPDG